MKTLFLSLLGTLLLCSSDVYAAIAFYINDIDQAQISTAVVVSSIGTSKVIKTKRGIRTVYDVDVQEVLYGEAPSKISVITYGGIIGSQTVDFVGNIKLNLGDYCVLFLLEKEGKWYPTALSQSKLIIEDDPLLGKILIRDNHQKLLLQTEQGVADYQLLETNILSLNDLRQQLKDL